MTGEIRILIADDHPLLRRGLREILTGEPDFRLVGEAGDGAAAVAGLEAERPDVAVLDIDMPGRNGLEVVEEMRRRGLDAAVILLTIHTAREYLDRALALDVRGYVLKDVAAAEIVTAVRQVHAGRHYISAALASHLVERRRPRPAPRDPAGSEFDRLTPAERRVLRLVAEYKTSREIAEELHVHPRTVETHRANIAAKLELRGSHALMKFALENRDRLG